MPKCACSILFISLLFQIVLCVLAQKSKCANVIPASFIWKDEELNKDCSARELENSSLRITHIQGKCSPLIRLLNTTWWNAIMESIKGDELRYRAIMKRSKTPISPQEDVDVPLTPPGKDGGNYIVKLGFGKPIQNFYLEVDTGSDVTWIPCVSCSSCLTHRFRPSKSSTYKYLTCASKLCQDLGLCGNDKSINCTARQTYGDQTEVGMLMSTETLSVSSQYVKEFVFGCAYSVEEPFVQTTLGLVGFGRGSLSFVSETAALYDRTFSYCLPSVGSSAFTGSLRLGKAALSVPGLKFTPLLSNDQFPSYYFLGLTGISVGKELVSIPTGMGKGTFIDSGTVISRLVKPAYNAMRDSFRRQMSNLTLAPPSEPLDTCYKVPKKAVKFPVITLHFGHSLYWTLPMGNTLFPGNARGSVLCLAFALPFDDFSVIGNYQQQNFRVVYDVPGSRLGITPEICDA
ncbi:aspartyl protease AED3-like [Cryptomeria japonica]|uniref:aspartyl protease AED3-like n=1 Tax=Cryptomeria japonica TaxID=3369 RepID=UPI0027DA2491|nr:aspartyl protease AED3-like [Cryptomeria japonica]